MTRERDDDIHNPYETESAANTNAPWLAGGPTVDVDLDGLGEYATHMQSAQTDLTGRLPNLSHLSSMPMSAWEGTVLGEADYVRHLALGNAAELTRYLGNLGQTLQHIAMAAQTVSDCYGSTDATGSASLASVLFAFGDDDVPRPEGLPPYLGKTYLDQVIEQAQAGTTPIDEDSGAWRDAGGSPPGPGNVSYQYADGPNGQRRVIETVMSASGTTVTTTVYAANGSVLSTSREVTTLRTEGGTQVRTTTSYEGPEGRPTGSTEQRTREDGSGGVVSSTTTQRDAEGAVTGRTTVQTDADGAQTTTRYDGEGQVTDQVQVGADTPGQVTAPESPAQQASADLPDMYLR